MASVAARPFSRTRVSGPTATVTSVPSSARSTIVAGADRLDDPALDDTAGGRGRRCGDERRADGREHERCLHTGIVTGPR